jgi:hypothetical protein
MAAMKGSEFFYAVMLIGTGLFGFGGLLALRRREAGWDEATAAGLRLALEFSLCAVILSLLPFVLFYMMDVDHVLWQVVSLFLALFLFAEIGIMAYKAQMLGLRWPVVSIFLLALSVVFLTIEVINTVWWRSLGWYAGGLTWVLGVAGVQFLAVAVYERVSTGTADAAVHYGMRRVVAERVRSHSTASRPNGAPGSDINPYLDPVEYARHQRYAHRFTNTHAAAHRGTNANTAVRSDAAARHR